MALIDDILAEDGISVTPARDYHFGDGLLLSDGDTVATKDGKRVRIGGIDAPETLHVGQRGIKAADWGAQEYHDYVMDLIENQGYNNLIETDEVDATGSGVVGDLANDKGETLSRYLLTHGVDHGTRYSSDQDLGAYFLGALDEAQREASGELTEQDFKSQNLREFISAGDYEKPVALDEAEYAVYPELYSPTSTQFRRLDRTLDNRTKDWQLDDALSYGYNNGWQGIYGAIDLIGDVSGWDSWSDFGEANRDRLQREMADKPWLRDMQAFDEEGNWTLDGISEFTNYVFSNAAASAPMMGVTMVSVALAAPTYGASMTVPAAMYTGMTYNEQDVKDPGRAVVSGVFQAALDAVGVKGTSAIKNMLTKKGRDTIVKEIATSKGVTEAAARSILGNEVKRQMYQYSKYAAAQMKASLRSPDAMARFGIITGGEATIEGLTEATQELFAVWGENNELSEGELQNRLMNALVAGGTLGAGFGALGAGTDYVTTYDAVHGHRQRQKSTQDEMDRAFAENHGLPTDTLGAADAINTEEVTTSNVLATPDETNGSSLEEQGETHRVAEKDRGIKTTAFEAITKGVPKLLRNPGKRILNRYQSRGKFMSRLGAFVGANHSLDGVNDENAAHLFTVGLSNSAAFDETYMMGKAGTSAEALSEIYYDPAVQKDLKSIAEYAAANGVSFPQAQESLGIQFANAEAKKLNSVLLDMAQGVHESNTKVKMNNMSKHNKSVDQRGLDKAKFNSNKEAGLDALQKLYPNVAKDDLLSVVDSWLYSDQYQSLDQAIRDDSTLNKKYHLDPQAVLDAVLGDPSMDAFKTTNFFSNIHNNTSRLGTIYNTQTFTPDLYARTLDHAYAAGEINAEEKAEIASELWNRHLVKTGQYKKINNQLYNKTLAASMILTTMNALPLATLSSLVEIALTFKGLTATEIFKYLPKLAMTTAAEMAATINEIATKVSKGRIAMREYAHREALRTHGYQALTQSIAARIDVSTNVEMQKRMNLFFKVIGLEGLTNIQRAMRISIATDAINSWSQDVLLTPPGTEIHEEAVDKLRSLGINLDVNTMQRLAGEQGPQQSQALEDYFMEQLKMGAIAFTNQAIAQPGKGSRPLIYNDPYWRLFTQFHGYMSEFTANILPGLLKAPFKGTVKSRIAGLTTLLNILALGFLSQALRDEIKYGEPSPYLDNFSKFQRGVGASGLLGTPERVLNIINPLYGRRGDNFIEKALNELAGEAPAVGYIGRVGDVVHSALNDGVTSPSTGKKFMKAAPLLGPFHGRSTGRFTKDGEYVTGIDDVFDSIGDSVSSILDGE